MTIQQTLELALQHHRAGRLRDAEAIYRQILAVQPQHADALHLLGFIAHQIGRNDVAVPMIRQAIALNPDNPAAHFNLGTALRGLGRFDEAVAAFRRALQLKPDDVGACNNLGVALRDQGHFQEAIAAFGQALQLAPDCTEAHFNLGNALRDHGQLGEAIAAYRRALQLKPDYAAAHNDLGNALRDHGQLDEAVLEYHRAIELQPSLSETYYNLGKTLTELGRIGEAVAAYRSSLQLNPKLALGHYNLGVALNQQGCVVEAIAAYGRALELQPDSVEACNNLGVALRDANALDEAVAAFRRAIELQPDSAITHSNLGNALKDRAQLDEAVESYRRAVELAPEDAALHSNLILMSLYHPKCDGASLRAECGRWEQRHAAPLERFVLPHGNRADPQRRLKIGYVSPDFVSGAVSHFVLPLLEAHDHAGFEIYCYASVKRPDGVTERARKCADVWRDVLGVRDEALAERIREDKIDILVDLTLHTANNRLLVFARKPAPVQVAWLGYPGSTGLAAMDYRLTDAHLEPEGAAWSESVETPVLLPDSWFCFDPIDEYPQPGELPARRAGHVTFGSLNNFCKVNDGVLQIWAAVLRAVQGSRLLLQCPAGSTQARVGEWFAAQGIPAHRLELISKTASRAEFLGHFARIDLALDTFPYTGGVTSCEALWMGVPVVTLTGEDAVARQTFSILATIGLAELAADSKAQYVEIARTLAQDFPRLGALRAKLRDRMKASPFMDASRFARNVEQAYREMWRKWCANRSTLPVS